MNGGIQQQLFARYSARCLPACAHIGSITTFLSRYLTCTAIAQRIPALQLAKHSSFFRSHKTRQAEQPKQKLRTGKGQRQSPIDLSITRVAPKTFFGRHKVVGASFDHRIPFARNRPHKILYTAPCMLRLQGALHPDFVYSTYYRNRADSSKRTAWLAVDRTRMYHSRTATVK